MKSLLNKLLRPSTKLPQRTFVNRLARIQLLPDHKISFYQILANESTPLSIVNINSLGIAFSRDSFSSTPELQSIIRGNLIINDISYPVSITVMHVNEKSIGCKYKDTDLNCKKSISTYLHSELMASSLYQINPNILKHDSEGEQIFFFGENRCELHLVVNDNKIIKFNISIMGEYIEVDKNKILTSGNLIEDSNDDGVIRYKGSALIQRDNLITEETKNKFIRFINYIDKLSIDYKNGLIEIIKNS